MQPSAHSNSLALAILLAGALLAQGQRRSGPGEVAPADLTGPLHVTEIAIPAFPGSHAIWGATGRDARGHIWVGVSATDIETPSAHLVEYVPETGLTVDRGSVVDELRGAGALRSGEGQMKIHTKIVQADDGNLYFASMDEAGELENGDRLPTWGSHLWRLRLPENRWEHLAAVPEGLIALSGGGEWIYALGYFGHVLYQFNTRTSALRSVRVGSIGGHISRNFIVDDRGHAYVPRLRWATAPPPRAQPWQKPEQVTVTLVEFDAALRQVGETRLEHYVSPVVYADHGIVGVVYLADRSMVLATAVGYLYHIVPSVTGPAQVRPLGWFHPNGSAYTPALFTPDGARSLVGIAMGGHSPNAIRHNIPFEWLIYDMASGKRAAALLPLTGPTCSGRAQDVLLYGSITRDNAGAYYLAGRCIRQGRKYPVLLKVTKGS